MGLVSILILILFVVSAVILILVVLIQGDQGEGIGGMFGGGSSTAFGPRSGNVLTRFTSIVGAIFIFGAFGLAWLNRTPETADVIRKARIERLKEAEEDDWWVEKLDEPEIPGSESIEPDETPVIEPGESSKPENTESPENE